ncbi:MAG: hypothetical protein NT052_00545 [Candidatus Shapirobacteria bacterium]|nr:hypothetical protein [Candidatus Shapirobacteria bacterium]
MTKMKNSLVKTIVIAIIVGVLGFYGGIQYQKRQKTSFTAGIGRTARQGSSNSNTQQAITRQGNNTNRPVSGEITNIDNNTITIKSQDGSSKIIVYSGSTTVNKTSEGSKEDLKIGEQTMIIGTEGSDGTMTAKSISIGGSFIGIGMPTGENKPIGQSTPGSSN